MSSRSTGGSESSTPAASSSGVRPAEQLSPMQRPPLSPRAQLQQPSALESGQLPSPASQAPSAALAPMGQMGPHLPALAAKNPTRKADFAPTPDGASFGLSGSHLSVNDRGVHFSEFTPKDPNPADAPGVLRVSEKSVPLGGGKTSSHNYFYDPVLSQALTPHMPTTDYGDRKTAAVLVGKNPGATNDRQIRAALAGGDPSASAPLMHSLTRRLSAGSAHALGLTPPAASGQPPSAAAASGPPPASASQPASSPVAPSPASSSHVGGGKSGD